MRASGTPGPPRAASIAWIAWIAWIPKLAAIVGVWTLGACEPRVQPDARGSARGAVGEVHEAGEGPAGGAGELRPESEPIAMPRPGDKRSSTARAARSGAAPDVVLHDHVSALLAPLVDPDDGWLLAHAVMGLGAEFEVGGGPAWRVLLQRHARPSKDGRSLVFGTDARGRAVEPHFGLVAKALSTAGVEPSSTVALEDGRQFRADATLPGVDRWPTFEGVEVSAGRGPHDSPGTLALGALDDLAWVLEASSVWSLAAEREAVVGVARGALAALDAISSVPRAARDAGQPLRKDGTGVFSLTCGGLHLTQALLVRHRHAPFGGRDAATLARVWAWLPWRFGEELHLIDEALRTTGDEATRLRLLGQRLKLSGHTLEVTHEALAAGVGDAAVASALAARSYAEAVATLAILEQRGVFRRDRVTPTFLELRRDLLGDALHALHGMGMHREALGRRPAGTTGASGHGTPDGVTAGTTG